MVAKLVTMISENAFIPTEILVQISLVTPGEAALGADINHGEKLFTESEVDPRAIQFGFNSGTSARCFNYLRPSDFSELKQDLSLIHI